VALVIKLDAMGFAISAGSACSSGTLKQSRALAAFGVVPGLAARTVRVSIGWSTSVSELEAFADAWREVAEGA
jgi:cysteine desulfurase